MLWFSSVSFHVPFFSFFGTMEDRMELTFGHELCLLCRHCYDQIRIDIDGLLDSIF